jgi:HAD superfamily hydrolase (TIGR01509 family)
MIENSNHISMEKWLRRYINERFLLRVMIKAVIFDFDGVLADSHGVINKVFARMINKELGIGITEEEFGQFPGMRFEHRVQILAKQKKSDITHERLMETIENARKIYFEEYSNHAIMYEGVLELFSQLKANHYKICLGSNGSKNTLIKLLTQFGIIEYFDNIVTFDDVQNGKPAPDMFLKNAVDLGLKPEECVVVEDSVEGITAAKSARMKVIAVKTTTPEGSLRDADIILGNIKDLNIGTLRGI